MKFSDIRQRLVEKIKGELSPLVDRDYRLLEIPDYPNVGDALIFQGEIDFLKGVSQSCREMATMKSFASRLPKIPEDELLIFSGGGYFGDLWPAGPQFQQLVLSRYPRNPMLILPQSVCFRDTAKLEDAKRRYGEHKNLIVCLRDKASYDFFVQNFPNQAYLVPDMGFFANIRALRGITSTTPHAINEKLLLVRTDKELKMTGELENMCKDGGFDIADWPTMQTPIRSFVEKIKVHMNVHCQTIGRLYDFYVKSIYRPYLLNCGIRFIGQYDLILSTRLHGCILALLLGKRIMPFDNSYGKINALIDTWLDRCDEIVKEP